MQWLSLLLQICSHREMRKLLSGENKKNFFAHIFANIKVICKIYSVYKLWFFSALKITQIVQFLLLVRYMWVFFWFVNTSSLPQPGAVKFLGASVWRDSLPRRFHEVSWLITILVAILTCGFVLYNHSTILSRNDNQIQGNQPHESPVKFRIHAGICPRDMVAASERCKESGWPMTVPNPIHFVNINPVPKTNICGLCRSWVVNWFYLPRNF